MGGSLELPLKAATSRHMTYAQKGSILGQDYHTDITPLKSTPVCKVSITTSELCKNKNCAETCNAQGQEGAGSTAEHVSQVHAQAYKLLCC